MRKETLKLFLLSLLVSISISGLSQVTGKTGPLDETIADSLRKAGIISADTCRKPEITLSAT